LKYKPQVIGFSWGKFTPELMNIQIDIIIAADVFYNEDGTYSVHSKF
jgi:hypothetical protein